MSHEITLHVQINKIPDRMMDDYDETCELIAQKLAELARLLGGKLYDFEIK